MKQFRVVALSSRYKLLVVDSQKQAFEYPIEGFKIVPHPTSRTLLEDLVGKNIQCTLNKAGTHIRYQNEPYLTEKIQQGVIQVVQKELEQSKIYNAEAKARLLKCQKKGDLKTDHIIDMSVNRKQMIKMFPRGGELKGTFEWLGEQMVVSLRKDNKVIFLPLRLKAVDTLFECLPESSFVHFIEEHPKITFKIDRPVYNLVKKRFEMVGTLDAETQLKIINEGWGIVNTAALASLEGASYSKYLKAQAEAKQAHKGVFSRNCQILAFIYAKNNFVGQVSDVLDGYIYEVTKKGGEKVKLELAMVRSPVGDEVGAFNSRQFARKQLIGQEVNVYLHKDSGLNITGSLVRARDSKDVQVMMVQQGWGFIREEFANSILSLKLSQIEKKAREKGKGLHSKEVGVHRPQDLTGPNTQKEQIYYYRRDETLKKLGQNETGVLEAVVDLLTYRVWLEDKNVIVKLKLQNIQGHTIDPLLDEVKQMKEEHKELFDNRLKKRSIQVSVVSYQRETNCFIGTITIVGAKTLQQILLEEAFVYCDRQNGAPEKLKEVEKKAKQTKKRLWSPALINFQPIDPLERQKEKFKGKFSWVEDGQTVFVQPESNYKTIDMIGNKLRGNMKKVSKESIVMGALVAAPYFDEYYRAKIISIKTKAIKVVFIDWGNKESIQEADIRQLPQDLKLIEKQCLKAKLYLARPINGARNPHILERVRNQLMDGGEFQFKKEGGEFISTYRNKQNIVLSLVERGIVKGNTDMADAGTKLLIQEFEAILKESKIGVWEWSDSEEEIDKDENDCGFDPN